MNTESTLLLKCQKCGKVTPASQFCAQIARKVGKDDYDLSRHPEHAKALGVLIASWANVEHALYLVMAFLLRAPPWRAHAAYYAIVNNNARVDLIKALVPDMFGTEKFRDPLMQLLDRARTLANRRNGYAHRQWLAGAEDDDVFLVENMERPFAVQPRKVQAREIVEVADDVMALAKDLRAFADAYSFAFPITVSEPAVPQALQQKLSSQPEHRPRRSDPSQA